MLKNPRLAAWMLLLVGVVAIGWLYLAGPSVSLSNSETAVTCRPLSWSGTVSPNLPYPGSSEVMDDWLGSTHATDPEERREAAQALVYACADARESRQTLITILGIATATAFLALTRPQPNPTET